MKFREKNFSKIREGRKILKYLKDHPVLPISAASLGIGIANYKTNTKRQKESVQQHKEQLKALEKLSGNISENSKYLNTLRDSIIENSNNIKQYRVNQGENYLNQKDVLPEKKKKVRKSIFGKLLNKDFSIQDGGFKGRKLSPEKSSVGTGAVVGGAFGAGIGAFLGHEQKESGSFALVAGLFGAGIGALAVWLNNIANESYFNLGLSTRANSYTLIKGLERIYIPEEDEVEESTETTTYDKDIFGRRVKSTTKVTKSPRKSSVSPIGTLFSVDSDPKRCTINLLLRGNVLVMLVTKPSNLELTKINNVLDKYCRKFKMADYSSKTIEKNTYLVEVNIVQNQEAYLVSDLINSGLKVNILTTDKFGIKNR